MAYITRAIEDILKNRFDTSKSVAITGARQVGKTTLTTHMYPKATKNLCILCVKHKINGFCFYALI
ncbi:MAG: hypothetical protein K5694_04355 [Bacilli bacterium]|nr:hypothetical protein [Bacilli bacterium]